MIRRKLNRKDAIAWYKSNRQSWVDSYLASNNPKVAFQCPICDQIGYATVLPSFNDSEKKYAVSYYCQECDFKLDDSALEKKTK